MKTSAAASLFAATCLLSGGILGERASAAPSAQGFICGTSNGAPSTKAVKSDGSQVDVIRWTSDSFGSAGWTPQRRCQEVSQRFDQYLKEGRLKYLTTGRMNGLPVICTALRKGGPCDGLLYTLKPGQNATATLENLLEVRNQSRGPINETSSRSYISIDKILNKDVSPAAYEAPLKQAPNSEDSPIF